MRPVNTRSEIDGTSHNATHNTNQTQREARQEAREAPAEVVTTVPQDTFTTAPTYVPFFMDLTFAPAPAAPPSPAAPTQAPPPAPASANTPPPSSSKFGDAMNEAKADGKLELYEVYHALALMADPDQIIEKLRNGDKDTLELMKTDAGLALIKQKIADAGALKDAFMSIIDDENNRRNRLAQNLGGR